MSVPPPEQFDGREVVAAIEVANDKPTFSAKYVIVTVDPMNARSFGIHTVEYDTAAKSWYGNGHYDHPWSTAIDILAGRAKRYGRPVARS